MAIEHFQRILPLMHENPIEPTYTKRQFYHERRRRTFGNLPAGIAEKTAQRYRRCGGKRKTRRDQSGASGALPRHPHNRRGYRTLACKKHIKENL